ncbi:MAG: AAA family ATPase [Polyangiaceae bacterium]|nr:AAA family ATPase [Polyangiaceae bacterium]
MASIRFPIGLSDFRALREGGFQYVDKSALITDLLAESAQVFLIPRPRRFGKTLNLSMLRCFFEKRAEDLRPLFEGLAVVSSESAWAHFQRYPVIFLTFKDIKPTSWEDCLHGMLNVLSKTFKAHRYLLNEGQIEPEDARLFTAILDRRATKADLTIALDLLSRLLAEHHGCKVLILLDEYDSPIHAGYTNKYYDEVVAFFRDFLSGGFKDNPHLWKGVLTGILRVAKESMFSGLNNIDVFSILRTQLSAAFGFTESEVYALAEAAGQAGNMDGIRDYYNGYLFGGQAIYNPWSVLSFFNRGDGVLRPYWIETSSNDLVRALLLTGPRGVKAELETLLAGGTVDKPIDENIVLRDISTHSDAVWSFLLFTGYLKAVELSFVEGIQSATLAVPNTEVSLALRSMARAWLQAQVGSSDELKELLDALLRGDAPTVERHLAQMVQVNLSFFDTSPPQPERFYHGLVVGLLAGLAPRYDVRSNRESGYGRCDVMVLPKTVGQPGVALELKSVHTDAGETVEKAFRAAFRQLAEKDYAAELRARGATPIIQLAAVFEGKRVFVRVASEKKAARKPTTTRKTASKKAVSKSKAATKKS